MGVGGIIHEGETAPYRGKLPISTTPRGSVDLSVLAGSKPTSSLEEELPKLVHQWKHTHSLLCVLPAPSRNCIFCGTQDSKILVFDYNVYSLKHIIECGNRENSPSVLCLTISSDENLLFSAGSDSLVKVWDLSMIESGKVHCSYIVYLLFDIGDIFSLSWSESLSTIFIGAQNASILWCTLPQSEQYCSSALSVDRLPHLRYDRFFDSKGPGGSIKDRQSIHEKLKTSAQPEATQYTKLVEIPNENVIHFAHNGFVYCMEYIDVTEESISYLNSSMKAYAHIIFTGGGDGAINIWGIKNFDEKLNLTKLGSLNNDAPILSMTLHGFAIYVGLSESVINTWDLAAFQLVRSYIFPNGHGACYDEISSFGFYKDSIFKTSSFSGLTKFNINASRTGETNNQEKVLSCNEEKKEKFTTVNSFNEQYIPQSNKMISLKLFTSRSGRSYLVAGGHKILSLWSITDERRQSEDYSDLKHIFNSSNVLTDDYILASLKKYITFKTILRQPLLYLEESRRCSRYLLNLLDALGAYETVLLPVVDGNPIVYSVFKKNYFKTPSEKVKRALYYAHYDVVDVSQNSNSWSTDPFVPVSKDGNLYARGSSDNKGPTLAAIFGVADLQFKKQLSCDVIFLIEGEEECGSIGFQDCIRKNQKLFGNIDWILLSNSYWIDDETPCLNYGLRGVIAANISIYSDNPDRHSGVDGGVLKEPCMDMVQVLNLLVDPKTNQIDIENFYDDVLPLSTLEIERLKKVEKAAIQHNIDGHNMDSLIARWVTPSLTIHKMQVSGPNNNTVIPKSVVTTISVRIVPNQGLKKIKEMLINKINDSFQSLRTNNHIEIEIFHEAEPWLGDPTNDVYSLLYEKVRSNWGALAPLPLLIREGGTIPSIRFLERTFNCPAAQIPCGQSSDNAHLQDEKIRILNLFKLRDILRDFFCEIGTK